MMLFLDHFSILDVMLRQRAYFPSCEIYVWQMLDTLCDIILKKYLFFVFFRATF